MADSSTDSLEDVIELSAEEVLAQEGRESVEWRAETLRWVLDHDDTDLTAEEMETAKERLDEYERALSERGEDR